MSFIVHPALPTHKPRAVYTDVFRLSHKLFAPRTRASVAIVASLLLAELRPTSTRIYKALRRIEGESGLDHGQFLAAMKQLRDRGYVVDTGETKSFKRADGSTAWTRLYDVAGLCSAIESASAGKSPVAAQVHTQRNVSKVRVKADAAHGPRLSVKDDVTENESPQSKLNMIDPTVCDPREARGDQATCDDRLALKNQLETAAVPTSPCLAVDAASVAEILHFMDERGESDLAIEHVAGFAEALGRDRHQLLVDLLAYWHRSELLFRVDPERRTQLEDWLTVRGYDFTARSPASQHPYETIVVGCCHGEQYDEETCRLLSAEEVRARDELCRRLIPQFGWNVPHTVEPQTNMPPRASANDPDGVDPGELADSCVPDDDADDRPPREALPPNGGELADSYDPDDADADVPDDANGADSGELADSYDPDDTDADVPDDPNGADGGELADSYDPDDTDADVAEGQPRELTHPPVLPDRAKDAVRIAPGRDSKADASSIGKATVDLMDAIKAIDAELRRRPDRQARKRFNAILVGPSGQGTIIGTPEHAAKQAALSDLRDELERRPRRRPAAHFKPRTTSCSR